MHTNFTDTSYHIVFGCDDNYVKYAAVTMQSIIENLSPAMFKDGDSPQPQAHTKSLATTEINTSKYPNVPITFHLLHDTLQKETKHKLQALETALNTIYPCTITFHPLSQEEFKNLTPWGEAGANWAAYFRLKIGDVLDSYIARCVYLDTDILVLEDIRELFMTDINDKAIGAVRNLHTEGIDIVKDGLVGAQEYCNSGMLLIDLAKWRIKSFEDIQTFTYTQLPDQDFINFIFKGSIHFLPLKWNFIWLHPSRLDFEAKEPYEKNHQIVIPCVYNRKEFQDTLKNPVIVHLGGGYKPWEKVNFAKQGKPIFHKNPYNKHWWRVARRNVFYLQILLPYLKRSVNTTLSEYTKAYIPALYPFLRKLKHFLKGKI